MRMRATLLFSFLISVPIFAASSPDFDPDSQKAKLTCLLARPFIFGASISGGYSGISDGTAAFAKLKASQLFGTDLHYFGGNPDPVTRLARKYNKNPEITNIAEIINQMPHSSIGPDQFLAYISASPENLRNAQASSVLASIDGLYWPTIYGDDCYWTESAIQGTREVIQFAKNNRIPMLLGSVPNEDPNKVSTLLTASGSWSPPKPQCVKMVNDFLRQECKPEDQCYILDMHRIVENLKGSLGPHDRTGIWYQGTDYGYNDLRNDGVHLYNSPTGSVRNGTYNGVPNGIRYVMTYIEKSVAWSLPSCK